MVAWRTAAFAAAIVLSAAAAASAQDSAQDSAENSALDQPSPAAAPTPQELEAARANPPSFADAWIAFYDGDETYFECVDERKRAALVDMWTRRAPLESAIYDLSLAYRQCPGFEAAWAAMYFAGYDSPEEWITIELQAAKAAALVAAESTPEAIDKAAVFLSKAVDATSKIEVDDLDARATARDTLISKQYIVAALKSDEALTPEVDELVKENGELLVKILPEKTVDELKSALKLVEERDTPSDLAEMVAYNP